MGKKNNLAQRASEVLRSHNLRATPIRKALFAKLRNSRQPLSVDELGDLNCDEVTLYRNLKAFEKAGMVECVELGLGRSFYEFKNAKWDHHHHVVCEKCLKIEHLEMCGLEPHFQTLAKMGYKKLRHKLEFSGFCRSCSRSN